MKKFISFSAVSSLFIMAGLVLSLGFTSSEVGAQDQPTVEFVDVNQVYTEPHPHFTITSSNNIFTSATSTTQSDNGFTEEEGSGYCTIQCAMSEGTNLTCGCPGCTPTCTQNEVFMSIEGIGIVGHSECSVEEGGTEYTYSC